LICARRIDGRFTLFYVLYDALFINRECSTRSVPALLVKDAVVFNDFTFEITEQRESHAYVFLEASVSRVAVDADAQNLRVALLEFGNISLIRLKLFRSTAGESQNIEGQHNILLAAKVREFNGLAFRIVESKVRSLVANLQVRLRSGGRLRICARLRCV
jgi:hypothetical protein